MFAVTVMVYVMPFSVYRAATHHCSLCDEHIQGFLMYTKHINSDTHRNRLTKYRQLSTKKDSDSSNITENSSKTTTKSTHSTNIDSYSLSSQNSPRIKKRYSRHATLPQKDPFQQSNRHQFNGLIGVYDRHGEGLTNDTTHSHQYVVMFCNL